MPLQKLSPLQSRLAGSLIASIALIALYFAFSSSHFAYAADVDSSRPEGYDYERLAAGPLFEADFEELELREAEVYRGEFLGYDEGIIGRAPTSNEPQVLMNNRPSTSNVVQGGLNSYSFLKSSVLADPSSSAVEFSSPIGRRDTTRSNGESDDSDSVEENIDLELRLKPRQSTRTSGIVYISVNACIQPRPIQNTTVEPPPQLQLYVSLSEDNPNPGPSQDATTQQMTLLEGGAAMLQINATGDIFIGLYGENTTAYTDVWNAQIAASIDGYYHTFHNESDSNLFLVDSDSSSALLITGNLTNENSSSPVYQAWMNTPPPFTLFAVNKDDRSILGLQNSYCGLKQFASIAPTANRSADNVEAAITNRGNNQPRQQFYVDGLTKSSTYNIALGIAGNTTGDGNVVGGGGQIWPMTNFTTLSDDNCAVVYDLSFCTQTAYAVPGNLNNFPNASSLAAFYDNATQAQYQFFENVLAQIPCETTSSAQYSLARNCSDCATAYKEWLCSVSIPRCTDWSSALPWLQSRNMIQPFPNGTLLDPTTVRNGNESAFTRSSRNPNIDLSVQPGPYKEVLPCDDLCYNVVQSCPASMGFTCPRPGQLGFNQSYGQMPDGSTEQRNQITCNYPGAAFDLSSSGSPIFFPHMIWFVTLAVTTWMFMSNV